MGAISYSEQVILLAVTSFFFLGILIAWYVEKKRLEREIWKESLGRIRSQVKRIRFAAEHLQRYKKENYKNCTDCIFEKNIHKICIECPFFIGTFEQAKLYLGTKKDNLLIELGLDKEEVKKKIGRIDKPKEMLLEYPERNLNHAEKLDYAISWFCERYADRNLCDFLEDKDWLHCILMIKNAVKAAEHHHVIKVHDAISLVLIYFPPVMSFVAAAFWVITKIVSI
ncbi:MAG: hypothetical protein D3925_02055 [Candidatus Electrothrix sp. AR5]|nr:hypothetical protein [Candidatus Electrothrix sp. AR5]